MIQTRTRQADTALVIEAIVTAKAEITKQDIPQYRAQKLYLNSQPFRGFPPGKLQFLGFFGAYDVKRRVYVGTYRFFNLTKTPSSKVQEFAEVGQADFNLLPGLSSQTNAPASENEPEEVPVEVDPAADSELPRKRSRKRTEAEPEVASE